MHPFVQGELALGNARGRTTILKLFERLQFAEVATATEVLHLIETEALNGLGKGYVDVHLLASARLRLGTKVWTRDKRLAAAAERIGVAFEPLQ